MTRLPVSGQDVGAWGDIMNAYLGVEHNADGTLRDVVRGADSRLSDSRTPSGAAGGDLGGTFPNPTLATGADFTRASAYKPLVMGRGGIVGNLSAGTTVVLTGSTSVGVGNASSALAGLYLDPADYPSGTRTLKLRIRGSMLVNNTGPAAGTWTFALYPVTLPAGAAASTVTMTLGTVVTGSDTCVITSPIANSMNHAESSDFNFPTAGWYALCCTNSANYGNANAGATVTAALQYRSV